jgi:hypothetical protein
MLSLRTGQAETITGSVASGGTKFYAASSALFKTIEVVQNDCLTYQG